jgi:hypothetical protein
MQCGTYGSSRCEIFVAPMMGAITGSFCNSQASERVKAVLMLFQKISKNKSGPIPFGKAGGES